MKAITRFNVFLLTACLVINALAINIINAQPVDTVQAKLVAKNFFADRLARSRISTVKGISPQDLEMFLVYEKSENVVYQNDQKKGSQTLTLYYIFNVKDRTEPKDKNGFIIVSADQRVPAVLGYSFTEEFFEYAQPPAFKEWMDHYKEQIIYAIQNNLKPNPEISNDWKKLSSTTVSKSIEQLSEVAELITTHWTQKNYYNNLCPADASCTGNLNGHVPAGCVAVAMAQIMRYHKYPTTNNPIPGYTSTNYGPLADIGVTIYNWNNMPAAVDYDWKNPNLPVPVGADDVATIVYHCGVAVQMNYGPSGSGAGSPLNAFKDYFKYSPDIQEIIKSDCSEDYWASILRDELDNNRPVYYAGYNDTGFGHAFVCDGYQGTNYFHFNFGGGVFGGDGYFYLYDLTPGNYDYTYNQWAITGISPSPILTIMDADGNHYNTVTIGSQTWIAENLKVTHFRDGTIIPEVAGDAAWDALTTGAYCLYGDIPANKDILGALYNWYTVNAGNLCPVSWHVPTDEEFKTLEKFLGMTDEQADEGPGVFRGTDQGTQMKNTNGWYSGVNGTNTSGFSALPGGTNTSQPGYSYLYGGIGGIHGFWWCSTEYSANEAWVRGLGQYDVNETGVERTIAFKKNGMSVRCVKDAIMLEVDQGASYGNISVAGQEEWFRFHTTTVGAYAIQTYGNTDTYMYLYNSNQTSIIAEDNDGAGSEHNSKIIQNLSANTWYYIKITGYNSSTGSYSISVNSLPAPPTANNVTATYDGLSHSASASVPNGISIVWYDAETGGTETIPPEGTDTGTYIAWAEAVSDLTGCTSATRTKVTLTIIQCLATWTTNDNHKTYGDTDPDPLTTGSGFNFVAADGITAKYNRNSGETAGDYHITATLEPATALTNYTITNTGATFTIDKKAASVTPNAASKYCGQTDPVFTGTLTGFLPDDNVSATYSRTPGETLEGSPYAISATLSPATILNNYDIAYNTACFTIMSVWIDASQSSNPVPVGSPSITLSAIVSDESSIPVTGVAVFFSIENGNNLITDYPAVFTDDSGVATLTIDGLASMTDVYKVTAVAGSGCGNAATSIAYLAVYDPNGSFVTGGGWINSPAGAYRADLALIGKANFGFVSKYKRGSNIPDGNTEFQFHAGNLNFKSSSYDLGSLVIAGHKAIYNGVGTINGTGDYKFMVSAVDGDVTGGYGYDKFRIKIIDKSNNTIVYDNNLGMDDNDAPTTVLGGGSIVIHKANEKPGKSIQMTEFDLKVYPNPFTDHIYFDLQLMTDSKVRLEIYDINGSKIATVYDDIVVGYDRYRFEYVPENLNSDSGTLIYRLIIDGQQMFSGKLIRY